MLILLPTACNNKQIYPYPHPMECGDGRDESKLCIPQEVLDYCYFKTCSYWVYRDSLTGVKDCVYVTRNSIIEIDNRARSGINDRRILQRLDVDMIHSFGQIRENFTTTVNVPGFNANVLQSISGTNLVSGSGDFFYPYTLNQNINRASSDQLIIKVQNKIKVLNKNYDNIFRYYFGPSAAITGPSITENSPGHTYFIAKNIGLVRNIIKFSDTSNPQNINRVWLLDNYKINQ